MNYIINDNNGTREMNKSEKENYIAESKKFLIPQYKQNLADTDYQAIKHSEGEMTDKEFEPIKLQRKAWREEINRLEKML